LTTYCDKKRGAVEISYRQFVYPNPSASRGEKIATSSLCAIAVTIILFDGTSYVTPTYFYSEGLEKGRGDEFILGDL
jgi:hypothetical protein